MREKINQFFGIAEKGSTIKTEIIAGITTYATMAYMFAVHSSNMTAAGMNTVGVIISMAILSAFATMMCGVYAKMPFAMAPGMGESAILAFTIVVGGLATWQAGVAIFAISGLLLFILGALNVRTKMVTLMPKNVKVGVGAAVGVFLIRLGVINGGLISSDMSGLGDFSDPAVMLCLVGLIVTIILKFFRIRINGKTYSCPYYLLISIALITIIGIPLGVTATPSALVSFDLSALKEVAFHADFKSVFQSGTLIVLVLYMTLNDIMSTMGSALGCAGRAGMLDEDGNLPGIKKIFLCDAVSTTLGGCMGLSNMGVYVESSAGIEEGGRTGLTAVVSAILFGITMFFWPIIVIIPTAATAPILLVVGVSMMECITQLESDPAEWASVALMLMLTAFTGDYIMGVALGVILNVVITSVRYLLTDKRTELPTIGAYILGVVMAFYFATQL